VGQMFLGTVFDMKKLQSFGMRQSSFSRCKWKTNFMPKGDCRKTLCLSNPGNACCFNERPHMFQHIERGGRGGLCALRASCVPLTSHETSKVRKWQAGERNMLLRAHMDPKRSGDDIVTFIRTDLARHNKFLSKV